MHAAFLAWCWDTCRHECRGGVKGESIKQVTEACLNVLNHLQAEVDMPLRRFRRQHEQMSQFERGRIIGMMEAGWSSRRVPRQLSHSKCVVRRCWDQWIQEMSFTPEVRKLRVARSLFGVT
ncbi:uncharacterized protein TNCV_3676971 [Trichonephila clavipes]|nr:uncharacterized protein TNCV_3676971 [Trichonephila clavipes]